MANLKVTASSGTLWLELVAPADSEAKVCRMYLRHKRHISEIPKMRGPRNSSKDYIHRFTVSSVRRVLVGKDSLKGGEGNFIP